MLADGVYAKETIMCELCPNGIADGRGNVVPESFKDMFAAH